MLVLAGMKMDYVGFEGQVPVADSLAWCLPTRTTSHRVNATLIIFHFSSNDIRARSFDGEFRRIPNLRHICKSRAMLFSASLSVILRMGVRRELSSLFAIWTT